MSHVKNKVEWCLRKAEREWGGKGKHRGLVTVPPDHHEAQNHVTKSEHYLKASLYLHDGKYSDICASTIFYSMYHCLLAIAITFGYESKNQECTFALVKSLAEDGKIGFPPDLLDKIASFDAEEASSATSLEIREQFQYGTSLTLQENIYEELKTIALDVLEKTKIELEKDVAGMDRL